MGLFSKKPGLEKIDIERLLKHGFIATGNKRAPVRYADEEYRGLTLNYMPHFLKGCFTGCQRLENLLYGCEDRETVTIHAGAFDNCANLKTIEIRSFSGGIVVEDGAFCNCPLLEKVYISYQFMRPIIGNEPFSNCPNAKIVFGSASTYTHGW
ncbi:leucine-rich repeat protein [Lachnospiraceae bacterium MD1]|uniref:Leucine-rich repeat protein n=1 Tax=Variimorphobacter saccharofermentans TaxID=2755051 RepID=A0A839K2U3_9FIRM|nr:leucine-rich repeat protein [Variimorphobacter saccharofermentans]MBB2183512.1 leucine-rich repeat protein [Variimorphobacter saccharofermentans]